MARHIEKILEVCKRLDNGRNIQSVWNHLISEVNELGEEVRKDLHGQPAGPDGIPGEAIDVILCAVDLIYQSRPNITQEEIAATVKLKLDKWERVYGNHETVDAEFTEVKNQ